MEAAQRQKRFILRYIYQNGPISRAELGAEMQVSLATISSLVRDLLNEGWIRETDFRESRGGRRAAILALNPDALTAIGIDVGYRHVAGARVNLGGRILEHWQCPQNDSSIGIMLDAIADAVRRLKPGENTPFAGVGIAVSGIVSNANLVSRRYPGNQIWEKVPLADWVEQKSALRPVVYNHVSAAALGEHRFGGWDHAQHMAYLDMGRGIAAGVIFNGKILRGASGNAGEFGHTTVQDEGPICYCGNRGCLETFSSPDAIMRQYFEAVGHSGEESSRHDINEVLTAAEAGDQFAMTVLEEAGQRIGRAAANLVNLLNPALLVLGGLLAETRGPLVTELTRVLMSRSLPALREGLQVGVSKLKENACVLGSAAAVMDDWLNAGDDAVDANAALRL